MPFNKAELLHELGFHLILLSLDDSFQSLVFSLCRFLFAVFDVALNHVLKDTEQVEDDILKNYKQDYPPHGKLRLNIRVKGSEADHTVHHEHHCQFIVQLNGVLIYRKLTSPFTTKHK